MPEPHPRRFATYLNDHLAVASTGADLARRTRASNEGTDLEPLLRRLEQDLTTDRDELRAVMARFGAREDRAKQTLAWFGEKLGRLKPNDALTSYSPLSRAIELEGLMVVSGLMRNTWATLQEQLGDDDGAFAAARERAERNLRELEAARPGVMRDALS